MSQSAVVHARIDQATKDATEKVLQALGMTPTEAIRLFYRQIALRQSFPRELHLPNNLALGRPPLPGPLVQRRDDSRQRGLCVLRRASDPNGVKIRRISEFRPILLSPGGRAEISRWCQPPEQNIKSISPGGAAESSAPLGRIDIERPYRWSAPPANFQPPSGPLKRGQNHPKPALS